MKGKQIVSLGWLLLLTYAPLLWADSVKYLSAEAVRVPMVLEGAGNKMEFTFEGMKRSEAWLKQNGLWNIEAWIQHNHLRCAHYQLGMQFGQGNPACIDVQWMGEPEFISRKRQCNNSTVHHTGSKLDELVAQQFDQITCARQVIKCTGVCD